MTIDKIAGTSAINSVQTRGTAKVGSVKGGKDSISVSKEAQYMSALYYADKVAAETPDVRADKVAQAKALLADPSWPDAAAISGAADGIMQAFGI